MPRFLDSEKLVGREDAVDSLDLAHGYFLGSRRIELIEDEEAGGTPSQAFDEGPSGAVLAFSQLDDHVIADARGAAGMYVD